MSFSLIDTNQLHNKYNSIGASIEKTFSFPAKLELPAIKGVKQAFIGILDAHTIIELISDENDESTKKVA